MNWSEGTGDGRAHPRPPETGYWAGIYERYHQEVRACFAGRVKCPHDVDDLVQDVFTSVIMQGNALRNPEAYVHMAARHQLWSYWRRGRKTDLMVERMALVCRDERQMCSSRGDPDSDPLGRLERMEMLRMVNAMMNRLSPARAEALRLRFIEGLPSAEAAAHAGCSRGALKKRLARARRFLAGASRAFLDERRICRTGRRPS